MATKSMVAGRGGRGSDPWHSEPNLKDLKEKETSKIILIVLFRMAGRMMKLTFKKWKGKSPLGRRW